MKFEAKKVTAAPVVQPPDEIHVIMSVDAAEAIRALVGKVSEDASRSSHDIFSTLGKVLYGGRSYARGKYLASVNSYGNINIEVSK